MQYRFDNWFGRLIRISEPAPCNGTAVCSLLQCPHDVKNDNAVQPIMHIDAFFISSFNMCLYKTRIYQFYDILHFDESVIYIHVFQIFLPTLQQQSKHKSLIERHQTTSYYIHYSE